MNVCIIKGNITRDIELKFSAGTGTAVAKFGVAVARMKKDDPADFMNCVAFGKTAELIANNLAKGSPILINGHIQCSSYDNKEGKKVYTTDIIVDRFEFLGKKSDNASNENNPSEELTEVIDSDDLIPF